MKITAIKYGQSRIWESVVFEGATGNGMLPISFIVYLIETENRKILVDAGCTTMPDCWEMEHFCGVLPILQMIGLHPHDITDVVLTHAHHDHIQTIGAFAKAHAYVHKREREEALPYIPAGMPVTTFEKEHTLCDGVKIVEVGGHSPGSSVVEIQSEGTVYVIAGDECYSRECFRRHIPTGASCNPQKSRRFIEQYSDARYTVLLCHDGKFLPDQSGYLVIADI